MGQAAVLNHDGTVNGASNPAPRGTVISVYMTGTGALMPAIADGSLRPVTAPYPTTVQKISAQIGYGIALVIFAGQAPVADRRRDASQCADPARYTDARVDSAGNSGRGYSSTAFSPQQSSVFVAVHQKQGAFGSLPNAGSRLLDCPESAIASFDECRNPPIQVLRRADLRLQYPTQRGPPGPASPCSRLRKVPECIV